MGAKSRTRAEKRKEIKKNTAIARLNNSPSSPRKSRLVADLIRGQRVEIALQILKNNAKRPAENMHKLLLSAIANWQAKNEGMRLEEADLFVKEIMVDGGRMLKRIQTAPQGRAHRIRKRSNHVTIILDSRNKPEVDEQVTEEVAEEPKKAAKKAPKTVAKAAEKKEPKKVTKKSTSKK